MGRQASATAIITNRQILRIEIKGVDHSRVAGYLSDPGQVVACPAACVENHAASWKSRHPQCSFILGSVRFEVQIEPPGAGEIVS
ncbi:MAG: hypothetical protein R3A46_11085 [Thermomicrobiales bacterium]